jgi:hypothetical protein
MEFINLHDLNTSQSDNIMKGFSDELEKAGKFLIGQLDKSGKNVKTADGWKPVKSHGHLTTHNHDGTSKDSSKKEDKESTPVKKESDKKSDKYKREEFKSVKIAEGDVMLRPDYKPGNYNQIKITEIKNGFAKFDIVDTFNGRTDTVRKDAGHFTVSQLQNFKDERDKKAHEEKEDINEKIHDISKEVGVDKLKGGEPAMRVVELTDALSKLADSFSNVKDSSTGAAAGWSGTMRSSVSGQAVSIETNDVHRGGYYEGSTPFLIQVKIGGGLNSKDTKVAKEVAKKILSKYSLKVEGSSETKVRETDGTNWSSVMLTAPSKGDSYNTQPSLRVLNSIRSK